MRCDLRRKLGEQRHQLIANASAQKTRIVVGRILGEGERVPLQVIFVGCAFVTMAMGALRFQSRLFAWQRGTHRVGLRVAVIGSRGVTQHRVDLNRAGNGEFYSRVEPHRRVRPPTPLLSHCPDDAGGLDASAIRRTGKRAGDNHRRVVQCLLGQVGDLRIGQKRRELTGHAHGTLPPLVQHTMPRS